MQSRRPRGVPFPNADVTPAQALLAIQPDSKFRMLPGDRRLPSYASDNFFRRIFLDPEKLLSKFVSPGDVAADLGCGPGYYTLPLARLVGLNGKVFAVDFDERAIRRVREKATERGLEGTIDSRTSSAADIGFISDESVDFVLAEGLLCCMVDHAGAVAQVKRILKKSGRAYLRVTRFARKSDPRAVTKEEWQRILGSFKPLESGQGFFGRWAVVSKPDGKPGTAPLSSSNSITCLCC